MVTYWGVGIWYNTRAMNNKAYFGYWWWRCGFGLQRDVA